MRTAEPVGCGGIIDRTTANLGLSEIPETGACVTNLFTDLSRCEDLLTSIPD